MGDLLFMMRMSDGPLPENIQKEYKKEIEELEKFDEDWEERNEASRNYLNRVTKELEKQGKL